MFNGFSFFMAHLKDKAIQNHPKPRQSWRRAASFGRCRTADVSIASASFALNHGIRWRKDFKGQTALDPPCRAKVVHCRPETALSRSALSADYADWN